METKGIDGMCRCCASSGIFKDMYATYNWMGEDEIYANMLQYCFDITLSTAEDQNNGGICEVCITQLRNAANFKKQVQQTEVQFKKLLERKEFSPKPVKIEITDMTELMDDAIHSDNEMSDSDAEFSVNIKRESPEPKAKKRAKATSSRADDDTGEPSTKRVTGLAKVKSRFVQNRNSAKPMLLKFTTRITPASSVSSKNLLTEAKKNQHNLSLILLNSNANPIRCKDSQGYGCAFCTKQFPQPTILKKHFLEEHNSDRFIKFMSSKVFENVVKLDITYLSCALCDTEFLQLNDFIKHLKSTHKKEVYEDVKSEILPFRFDTPELRCAICSTEYTTFKILQTHMNQHFSNYTCKICAGGFVTERLLQGHIKRHGNGEYKCTQCDKPFPTLKKREEHVQRVHLGLNKRNKCKHCDERFVDYWQKVNHMVKMHGEPPVVLKCQACERTFNNQRVLSRHHKKDHLLERRYPCLECDMKFFTRSALIKHMAKHTGLRQYTCDICHKSYGRKNTLREHLRIHADDRRYKCEYCGQGFVQKCSWRGHMRSKHGEKV
ncbi:PREDICTED: zinc finger protein Xfin-like isoform X4 [Papilio xuthus]|uniref:Zinc finger protein Xfin-like isoform X4 n=1 Tax=Papilio xuthus TaxID=66420 RepID=A0AAJ7E5K7_PAPXU|nr:PREDICTED: zinc finger protein Xfin-like isoform X4 [Papilio xuthus]